MLIKLFETLGALRIKYRLTKSKIFLDDESADIDDKDSAVNPSNANSTKRQKPTNCLSVFDHFVGLALKGLTEKANVTQMQPRKVPKNVR